MLYSCTHMATVGIKGLTAEQNAWHHPHSDWCLTKAANMTTGDDLTTLQDVITINEVFM